MSDWNGLPDQPERSGYHWLAGRYCPERWRIAIWNAKCNAWLDENMSPDMYVAHKCIYGGPALNPSELAQMRKDERERCALIISKRVDATYEGCGQCDPSTGRTEIPEHLQEWTYDLEEIVEEIRALTDDEGNKS